MNARRVAVVAAALCGALSCQQPDSVVVVSVYAPGLHAIDQLRALMSNGPATSTKLFPEQRSPTPLAFTPAATFAIVVPRGRTGAFDIALDGLSDGTVVANGAVRAILTGGGRTDVPVTLAPGMSSCGNGGVEADEQCDDGNRLSGDGCDFRCQLEAGSGGVGGGAGRGGAGGASGAAGGAAAGGSGRGGGAAEGGGPAGGAPASGGVGGTSISAMGGAGGPGTGGAPGSGGAGMEGSGAVPGMGGSPGTGGMPATGGAAGMTAAGGAGGAAIDPTLSSLEVWYRFDDGAGTAAADSSGKGRTGTLVSVSPGAATFSAMAEIGSGAVALAGQSTTGGGYVLLPGSLGALAPDAITISCWVNLRTSAAEARIFDFGVDANTSMFLTPRHTGLLSLGSDVVQFQIMRGSLTQQSIQSTSALPTGGWHHVAVVLRSGSPYTGALYVDGALAGMNTNMTLHASDLGVTINNWLGRSTSSASDPFIDGLLDDFRLYSRALADSEVAMLYQSGTSR